LTPATRSILPFRARLVIAVVAVVVVVGLQAAWVASRLDIPMRFWLSQLSTISIDGRQLRVVHVDYQSGLREVPSLGALDGALFELPSTMSSGHGMGMDRVLIPLDVAFFDSNGRFVDRYTMAVCSTGNCPGYYPTRSWQFAIEAPAGELAWVTEGSVLRR